MKKPPEIHDIETFGSSTRFEVVRAEKGDERGWIGDAPICELLSSHHIAHVGRMWTKPPFKVIRAEASGTFVLVGLEGRGEALIDGNWREVNPGEICLQPAFSHTGIRAANKEEWSFAWVRYEESRETCPVLSSNSPVIHSGSVLGLNHAIAGLHVEVTRRRTEPTMLHHWVELIHGFVNQAARPYQEDDRLWRLWEAVENNLSRHWRLADLAEIACSSSEHLRRLCQQQLGRSPVQQVTYLRMRRAVHHLTTTQDKVETIAQKVGYENPFTFSNAFKRWTGRRPTDYREQG
ncbi:AraC family transcriptional regulator [Akkermansiaceae bacterium]|nr:AraC family transcriptional regulator [Akkermansiaceae bacterium]MDB4412614.1 AraC family transcriptional regulator [bacterium]MDB4532431.1 AraC family transcriptional regulator [bacterium]